MAHPSDVLKTGDIALGRFAAAQFVDSHTREIGTRVVGKILPAHPLLVLDVDRQKREATVMLLGTEKEGNAASQLGFNKKEQELAKLERQTVFKPHSLSVMPIEKLYPNQGGFVSEETMSRVHKELGRTIQDRTVSITHLSRDGTVSMYDMARQRPGRVIMEAPAKSAAYEAESRTAIATARAEQSSVRATANVGRAAETIAEESRTVLRATEVAEAAIEVAKFAGKEGVKLFAGPAGDVAAVADLSMAAFSFVDNHTGHAISQGPLGRGVMYLGEKSGAFQAAHEVAEIAQPYIDKAHKVVDPIIERGEVIAHQVADKTGVTAAANYVGDRISSVTDWAAHQIESVQKGFADVTRAAGLNVPPLTPDEAKLVATGMAQAKPGEVIALHPSGSMELLAASQRHVQPEPGVIVMDAQAFKQQMGLTSPTRPTSTPPHPAAQSTTQEMSR